MENKMVKKKKNQTGNKKRKRKKNRKKLFVIDISSIPLEDLDVLDTLNNSNIENVCKENNIVCYNINSFPDCNIITSSLKNEQGDDKETVKEENIKQNENSNIQSDTSQNMKDKEKTNHPDVEKFYEEKVQNKNDYSVDNGNVNNRVVDNKANVVDNNDRVDVNDSNNSLVDNKASIVDNKASVVDNKASVVDNKDSIVDNKASVVDNNDSVVDNNDSVVYNNDSVVDDNVRKNEQASKLCSYTEDNRANSSSKTCHKSLNNKNTIIKKKSYEKNNIFLKPNKSSKIKQVSTAYCSNCGKMGHSHNVCLEPLTSFGLICFKRVLVNNNYVFKTVLVKRKFSIGLIELLRGKYQLNNDKYILKLINLMTISEKNIILKINDFDRLREYIKMQNGWSHNNKEYNLAKEKFNILKQKGILSKLISKSSKTWSDTEWGLPKGRRNNKESNLDCAIREFIEETGISQQKITILKNVKPLEEIYIGINNIKYKHIYYFSIIDGADDIDNGNVCESNLTKDSIEIGDVKWFTLVEIRNIIRYYYINKYNIIRKGFQLINNLNYYFSYH